MIRLNLRQGFFELCEKFLLPELIELTPMLACQQTGNALRVCAKKGKVRSVENAVLSDRAEGKKENF